MRDPKCFERFSALMLEGAQTKNTIFGDCSLLSGN